MQSTASAQKVVGKRESASIVLASLNLGFCSSFSILHFVVEFGPLVFNLPNKGLKNATSFILRGQKNTNKIWKALCCLPFMGRQTPCVVSFKNLGKVDSSNVALAIQTGKSFARSRELKFFLGILIHQSPRGIFINQAKYAQEILKKHGMTSCDSIGTPMANKPLDADLSGSPVDQTKYHSMVGALMYLTSSRPDIVHATCYCARYQARPTKKHLKEVKRIFWYLKNTIHMGLCDKLVSWSSKKQDCTSMSSAKSKYHFIKEHVKKGIVELFFVGTEYQLADLFTKALPEDRFKYLVRRLGMRCLTPDELEVLANESA
ncbi:hypothetical protein Tco_0089000 [Tanacetum coccineum]